MSRWPFTIAAMIAAALLCFAELTLLNKFLSSSTLRFVVDFILLTIIIYLSDFFYRRCSKKK